MKLLDEEVNDKFGHFSSIQKKSSAVNNAARNSLSRSDGSQDMIPHEIQDCSYSKNGGGIQQPMYSRFDGKTPSCQEKEISKDCVPPEGKHENSKTTMEGFSLPVNPQTWKKNFQKPFSSHFHSPGESGMKRPFYDIGLPNSVEGQEGGCSDIALMSGALMSTGWPSIQSPESSSLDGVSRDEKTTFVGSESLNRNRPPYLQGFKHPTPNTKNSISTQEELCYGLSLDQSVQRANHHRASLGIPSGQDSNHSQPEHSQDGHQDEPQSAEMEISPLDLLHPSIIHTRPYLQPMTSEETQSHHPSTLPRSPHSSQLSRRSSSHQSNSDGEHDEINNVERFSKPLPGMQKTSIQPAWRLSPSRFRTHANDASSGHSQLSAWPPSIWLPRPNANIETRTLTSPLDHLSNVATTDSPVPRPDTPRPISPDSVRQSVERDGPLNQKFRESTPAYTGRSDTPSPVSRNGVVDVNISDVHTPTPSICKGSAVASVDFRKPVREGSVVEHVRLFNGETIMPSCTSAQMQYAKEAELDVPHSRITQVQSIFQHQGLEEARYRAYQEARQSISYSFDTNHNIVNPMVPSTASHPSRAAAHGPHDPQQMWYLQQLQHQRQLENNRQMRLQRQKQQNNLHIDATPDPFRDQANIIPVPPVPTVSSAPYGIIRFAKRQDRKANIGTATKTAENHAAVAPRRNKSLGVQSSGTRIEKGKSVASRSISRGRAASHAHPKQHRKAIKSRPVVPAVPAAAASMHRRIDSNGHEAMAREVEGQGKRRSARIKTRRSEGRDVLYTE